MFKLLARLLVLSFIVFLVLMLVAQRVGQALHGDMIAFTSDRDGATHQIYVVDVATGVIAQLSNNDNTNSAPHWSPDGQTLAWLQGGAGATFWGIDMGELRVHPLSDLLISSPIMAWAPDGQSFLFEKTAPNGYKNIIRLNPKTGEATNLTDQNILHETSPAWSPDGQAFVYNYQDNVGNNRLAIYNFTTHTTIAITSEDSVYPSWSADGQFIAYINRRGATPKLTVMRPDQSDRREMSAQYTINYAQPQWSPTSPMVAFGLNSGEVLIYHVDSGRLQNITPANTYDIAPVWSPDGQYLVVVSNTTTRPQTKLTRVNVASGERQQLTIGAVYSSDRMPEWRP